MSRQPAGHEENGVDADVVAVAGVAGRQPLGRDRDPAQAVLVESHGGAFVTTARLHLNEGEHPPAPRNEVDFAAGHAGALRQDAPAVQPQPPGRQPFRPTTALLGNDAAVQRLSSSARA